MATKINRSLLMRKFHALLNETGLMEHKTSFLIGYGKEHASDLSDADLQHLTDRIISIKMDKVDYRMRMSRSAVLTVLQKLGVYATSTDWTKVNEYLLQPKVAGKLLYELNFNELQVLIVKLNSILSKQEKKDEELKHLAANN